MNPIFQIRRGRKSKPEIAVVAMGWVHLGMLILTVLSKFGLGLYFAAAGWAAVLRALPALFSGAQSRDLFIDNKAILLSGIGTGYALYHVVVLVLFVLALRRGVSVGTYLFAILSLIALISFTAVGFNFRWT